MADGSLNFPFEEELSAQEPSGNTKRTTDPAAAFPYYGLEESVTIARALFEHGADTLSRDQLAAAMHVAPSLSTFQVKLMSARTFGLVEVYDGKVRLTDLGGRISSGDEQEARKARRDAFLHVPLYSKTYADFKGKPLPPSPTGLEQRFQSYGVVEKQKDKARRAFENSAQFAGFFASGRGRLVEPIIGDVSSPGRTAHEPKDEGNLGDTASSTYGTADPIREPLIHGLLVRMPKAGTEWDYERRAKWLRLLASVIDEVYTVPKEDEGRKALTVECKQVGAS